MTTSTQTFTLLAIEDDPAYLDNIEVILRMEGFRVLKALGATSALALLQHEIPDLILCDIMMPEMDGYTFFDMLKQDNALAAIPFIFITALDHRNDIRKGMAAGVDDYLTKPFSTEELVAAVYGRLERVNALKQKASQTSLKKDVDWLRNQITKRELEVLLLVGGGATSKQIAKQLCISIRTVENHRTHLMGKLDAPNAATLAHWALVARQL
ncbi:MAG: response regulator transcription factor [Chlorobiaceae bacterium]